MKWILIVLLIWLSSSSVVIEDGSDWPMFQHDPQHTGYSHSSMPSPLKKVWISEELGRHGAYVVISRRKLFVATWSSLFSLDVNDGSVLWSLETKMGYSTPAVANGNVYVGARDKILCLDVDTGDVLWNYDVELLFYSSPLVINEYVIIGGGHPWGLETIKNAKRILCLHAETGELLWEFYTNDITNSSPAYFDGRIYSNDGGGRIYCLHVETGELIWEKITEGNSDSSLSLDENNIFIGDLNGILNCYSRKTGDILWTFDCGDWVFTTPAVAYNKVFIGSENGIFYCLDAQIGELIWKIETGDGIPKPKKGFSCSALVADGKVAFGTDNGVLYIVDVKTGKICESYQLDESGITALALSDGKLLVGQENGKITCFEGSPSKKFILVLMATVVIMVSVLVWYQRKKI